MSDEKTLNGIPESLLIRVKRAPEHWAIEAWKEYKEKYGEWPSAEKINAMRSFVYTAQQLHDFKTPLTKDEKIKEVMDMADYMAIIAICVGIDIAEGHEEQEKLDRNIMQRASDSLESKLRELIK